MLTVARRLTGATFVVAGLALAATGASPAVAAPSNGNTDANVGVNNTISMSGVTASFTLTGDPNATVSAPGAVTMNVKCNNRTGYTVSVQAGAANFVGANAGNSDTFAVTELKVTASGASNAPVSPTTARQVHSRSDRTTQTGDAISNDYAMTIPWIAPDTYVVTLQYIAAAR